MKDNMQNQVKVNRKTMEGVIQFAIREVISLQVKLNMVGGSPFLEELYRLQEQIKTCNSIQIKD